MMLTLNEQYEATYSEASTAITRSADAVHLRSLAGQCATVAAELRKSTFRSHHDRAAALDGLALRLDRLAGTVVSFNALYLFDGSRVRPLRWHADGVHLVVQEQRRSATGAALGHAEWDARPEQLTAL